MDSLDSSLYSSMYSSACFWPVLISTVTLMMMIIMQLVQCGLALLIIKTVPNMEDRKYLRECLRDTAPFAGIQRLA